MEYMPQQSPIDLGKAGPITATFPSNYLTLRWPPTLYGRPVNTPHGIEFIFDNLPPNVGLQLGDQFYGLVKFHFHAASEHRIDDRQWPVEVHIVHGITANGPYVVLGVFVDAGAGDSDANDFFRQITQRLTGAEGSDDPMPINPRTLLPRDQSQFFRYEGSLTTKIDEDNPENVSWVIYRDILRVDSETLMEFIALGHQSKDPQDLNRRFVLSNFVFRP